MFRRVILAQHNTAQHRDNRAVFTMEKFTVSRIGAFCSRVRLFLPQIPGGRGF